MLDLIGKPFAVAAPGPSLSSSDCERIHSAGIPLIAIGEAHKAAPFADILYHTDGRFWQTYDYVPEFAGLRVTQDKGPPYPWPEFAKANGLRVIESVPGAEFRRGGTTICQGANSGFAAIAIACMLGAPRVILTGFDMGAVSGRQHYAENRPARLCVRSPYARFALNIEAAARTGPVPIVDTTESRRLRLPYKDIGAALEWINIGTLDTRQ